MSPSKLVRDRIPERWEGVGSDSYRMAEPTEMRPLLLSKLQEECGEAVQDLSLEELADVVEVVRALVDELGASWTDLEDARQRKAAELGAFSERVVWAWTEGMNA